MTTIDVPDDRLYSDDHEWIAVTSPEIPAAPVRVGISRVAADALGDLVYLDLPEIGATITAQSPCGELESTKTVSDLVSPVSGTVTEVNTEAVEAPELVTGDPYGAGWLFAVQVSAMGPLMTATEYAAKNGQA
ncbi:glycine cleavage system H protein [Mycobacterium sp. BK558]|nr:glycine cleavage system protein GcvH [Mycolicibacterium rufum]RZT19118.1 glycine cleavage system H protein [Mycobacterium sp. BK558]